MKRMTKFCLMAALGFGIVGGACGIGSFCTGFTIDSFVQAVNSGEFQADSVTGDIKNGVTKITEYRTNDEGKAYVTESVQKDTAEIEHVFEEIENLEIKVGAAACRMILWPEETWSVKGYNLPDGFIKKSQNGDLEIDCTENHSFLKKQEDMELEIYIPADTVLKEVELKSGVGEITVENGFLKCRELKLECGVGTCDIYADAEKEIQIEGGVGEVYLTLSGKETDYDYELECGLGSIQLGEENYEGAGIKRKIDHQASCEVQVECGIGNIEIFFEE